LRRGLFVVSYETFATEFIRKGGAVQALQKLMGHTKITTTMKYVHVDEQMLVQAVEEIDSQNELA
jgi:site-specific recombinase XerD